MANRRKQRKAFTDMLGKPLKPEDVAMAVRVIVRTGTPTAMQLQRSAGIGIGKGGRILALLEAAGVLKKDANAKRTILLRSEPAAINAALRKLREGNK